MCAEVEGEKKKERESRDEKGLLFGGGEREKEREGDSAKRELRPFCCAEITPWGLCESSFPTHLPASGLIAPTSFYFYLLSLWNF